MINPCTLPRGVAMLFSIGDRVVTEAEEPNAFRTDRILSESSSERIQKEIYNNWISCVSPITFYKEVRYIVLDDLMNSWFRRF